MDFDSMRLTFPEIACKYEIVKKCVFKSFLRTELVQRNLQGAKRRSRAVLLPDWVTPLMLIWKEAYEGL